MASASLHSLHLPHLHHRHRRHLQFPPTTTPSSSPSIIALNLSSSIVTPATASPTFDALAGHLAAANFRQADEETRGLLIALAGDAAQKRGYIFFSEVQFLADEDLRTIDELWRRHSGGRFGYGVQRRLWEKADRDFSRFFVRVGWMRRLETEVEQYTYRSFPGEFIWELGDNTPEGHLPLTNALRGTQLLESILTHPAFEPEAMAEAGEEGCNKDTGRNQALSTGNLFKADYSF
ncbi:hypothetical protein HPP92_008974 [Vanilla planifolia]|uniref:GUN4-like domain-containing protein n=1 Tax=Vanilla planifolia TaxID=51239 RepID=A0A835V496_VANPL|nr:hypothetical protein HPP92_008974 [Vanilla planifolia]